jgi:tetratricopeptide (TPR) repeat protein
MKTLLVIGMFYSGTVLAFGQSDTCATLQDCQKALKENPNSSVAHYGTGQIFFQQRNWQSAANEFREALNGDLRPQWTEVWSHIQLGKIFDMVHQRERAVNEYRQAERTNDHTRGALEEAAKYLKSPYDGN